MKSFIVPLRAARRPAPSSRPLFFLAMTLLGLGSAALANTQVEPFYGAFGTEVDIEVPKFRSLEPSVKLTYSSTAGNGFVGVGWSLSTASVIQRGAPGSGAPRYDGADTYYLDGQELVPCTTLGGSHCTRIQSYQRIQWDGAANRWIVTQKSGVRATYTPLVQTALGTFRWGLSSITDTHNNTVSFNYWCDAPSGTADECYLDNVTYNGATVRFYRETRPDPVTYGRGTSTLGRIRYRLKTIDVLVGASRARAYQLGYTQSPGTGRSLLSSVRQFGNNTTLDGAGTITGGSALPPTTVDYQSPAGGFAKAGWSGDTYDMDVDSYNFHVQGDFNGDGRSDLAYVRPGWGNWVVLLSNGAGFTKAYWGGSAVDMGADNLNLIRTGDFNGDGKTDIAYTRPGWPNWYVLRSTGTSFVKENWGGPANDMAADDYNFIHTGDFDGDGKTDLAYTRAGWGGWYILRSTGAAFTKELWGLPTTDLVADGYNYILPGDFNGDGKTDLAYARPGWGGWYILRSTGGGFVKEGWAALTTDMGADTYNLLASGDFNGDGRTDIAYTRPGWPGWNVLQSTGTSFIKELWNAPTTDMAVDNYNYTVTADFNGDGLTDIAYTRPGWAGWYVSRSTGTGFVKEGWSAPTTDMGVDGYNYIHSGDFDGDGKTDITYARPRWPTWATSRNPGAMPDLAAVVRNGIGGSTSVQYRPSSAWSNTYLPAEAVLQTAATITLDDGRGSSSTTSYTYQGGLWSSSERRFLGFRRVQAVIDAAGNYTETYYHQHVGCIAKPEVTYYRDAAGNLFSYSSYGYSENAAPPYTSLLTTRWDYECNQIASCRRILTQIGYDAYGNANTTYEYGDYDVAGDERTVLRGYYPNTTSYIAAAAAYENIYSGIGTATLIAQTLYEYDGNTSYAAAPGIGELRRKKAWNSQTGGYATTSYGYDAWGNIAAETNALGATRTTDYDPSYHLYATRKCDALGTCSTQSWDYVFGQTTAITDANSLTTSYTYDALGRPARKTAPDGGYLEYSYLNWGSATSQRTRTTLWDGSADGLWKDSYQDGLGREYLVEEEGGFRKETLYRDASSRIWRESLRYQVGESPVYRTYSYDGAGRVRFVTNPDNTSGQRVYGNGYEIVYDENNREQVLYKDAQGRTIQVRERNQGAYQYTSYSFDALGRLTRVTDAAGNATTFGWDSLGRKTSACDPDMGCWSYTYDDAGNLLTQRDAKGQTLRFAYDVLGRMTSKTYPDNQQAVWRYDEAGHGAGKGKLTSTSDPSGSESLVYDFAGRITQATKCISGTCATLSYAFDRVGRASSVTFHDGEVVTYGYDASGRLTSLSGYVSALGYNSRGQLTSANYANGTRTTYGYNASRMWLSSAQVQNAGGATLYQASYGYDAGARVTSMSSSTNPLSNLTLGYDELSRLTTVSGNQSQSFAYNAVGNLTSSSTMGAYGYGDTTHRHAVTTAGAQAYQYDVNGNLVLGGGRSIAWDYDNRPASITSGGQTVSFAYDTTGVRVRKSSPQGATLYFGNLLERRPDGTWVKYVYAGPSLVARSESAGRYWYHQDHLGSARLITDAAGSVVKRLDFAAFGKEIAQSGALMNARGYTGHVSDPETGLVYMNARYYDPDLGRFLSPDPLVPEAVNPQALNRYSYVYNNPISNVDPSGHAPVVAAVFVVGSAFASGSTLAVTVALIGAATTTVGYIQKDPTLLSIGSILLGFAGGYAGGAGFLGSPGLSGGLVSASIAAVTSPISPLDPSIKQAIGWAFTAQSLIKGFTSRAQTSDASGRDIQEPPGFEAIERRVQGDARNYGGNLSEDIATRLNPDRLAQETAQSQGLGYYGSSNHQLYGGLVERLTDGRISAADALRLNPCGGLVGPACGTSSQLLSGIFRSGPVYQHALLHDALGFLRTTAGIGPGYTYTGFSFLAATSPLGGQLSGIFWHIPYRGWIPGISVATTLVPWSQRSR